MRHVAGERAKPPARLSAPRRITAPSIAHCSLRSVRGRALFAPRRSTPCAIARPPKTIGRLVASSFHSASLRAEPHRHALRPRRSGHKARPRIDPSTALRRPNCSSKKLLARTSRANPLHGGLRTRLRAKTPITFTEKARRPLFSFCAPPLRAQGDHIATITRHPKQADAGLCCAEERRAHRPHVHR